MSYASSAYVDVVEDGGSRSIGVGIWGTLVACEVMVLGAVGLEWYWRRKEGISEGNGNEVVRDTECLVDFSTSDVEYVGEGDNDNYNDNDNDNDNGNGNDNDKTTPLIKHPTTPTSTLLPHHHPTNAFLLPYVEPPRNRLPRSLRRVLPLRLPNRKIRIPNEFPWIMHSNNDDK